MFKSFLLYVILFSILISTSFAQKRNIPITEYDFEADDFVAKRRSPEGLFITGTRKRQLNSLIKIRKDFKREIIKAADAI